MHLNHINHLRYSILHKVYVYSDNLNISILYLFHATHAIIKKKNANLSSKNVNLLFTIRFMTEKNTNTLFRVLIVL